MKLQVKFNEQDTWGTIRTSETEGESGYKYLQEQQNDWFHNGPPEYRTAEYRIGDFEYSTGEEVFVPYPPKRVQHA